MVQIVDSFCYLSLFFQSNSSQLRFIVCLRGTGLGNVPGNYYKIFDLSERFYGFFFIATFSNILFLVKLSFFCPDLLFLMCP